MTPPSARPAEPTDLVSTLSRLARDPAARTYLFMGAAALLILGAALFVDDRPLAAGLPTLIAAAGLITRHPAVPPAVLAGLGYLLAFPDGVPLPEPYPWPLWASYFRLMDMVVAGATLVYLTAHYRLAGLTRQAVPSDTPQPLRPKGEPSTLRTSGLVGDDEFAWVLATAGAAVVAGQLAWFWVAGLRVEYTGFPPFRLASPNTGTDPGSRLVLLIGLAAPLALVAGLTFWYWRLARLTPAEAWMMVLDTGWREARRELARQETWRARVRNRRLSRAEATPLPSADPPPPRKPRRWARGCAITLAIITGGLVFACLAAIFITRLQSAWPNRR
ncbi:MAG: hypothetical protein U0871_27210 [Gemmataceae bacterium]